MKTSIFKTVFFFSLINTLLSCSENDNEKQTFTPTLPAITKTGANTFGCFMDGKLLTPRDGNGGIKSTKKGITYSVSPDDISYNEIYIDDWKSENGSLLRFHIADLKQKMESSYIINKSNCQNGFDANDNVNINCRVYDDIEKIYKWYCSTDNGGKLIITRYDINNRIVSGTFNCKMKNKDNPKDIIEITEGRFDIKWDTLDETIFP
ncbi:hypothetical protein [Polaribacter sp.]|uniref:hypothetical protein n=1 Tax=Polaribacter sp. TaxID=1920175 RepID=UPI003F6C248E